MTRQKPRIPKADLPPVVPARPGLRVAVILDPFSELAFRYEWDQVTFGPEDWHQELTARRPDLLFVESAWQGNQGRWRLHQTRGNRPSAELQALVAWARSEGIPTVFWNKEDPPNYDVFLETARLFDQVFTVDADRIDHYRRDLGHDRIGLLPFAAQPRIHRPVRRTKERHDVAFAGTFFADKHPERRAQVDWVLGPAREFGVHIWSRLQKADRRYRFPRAWKQYVVGSLPYERMLAAYPAYKVFLNVNSVTGSKTMCSRRLFELSAAQTAVLTAPAESIEPFFGDTVEVTETHEQTRTALKLLLDNDEYRDRKALQAHRRVFDDHLYAHRVDTVLEAVGLDHPRSPAPTVSVVVPTRRPEQLDHVLRTVGKQSWAHKQLVLVTHGFTPEPGELRLRALGHGLTDVVLVRADADQTLGRIMDLGVAAATGELVAKVDDDNFHGVHYLTDLVRALDYSGADVVGKWAHLVHLESSGATLLRFAHAEHRFVEQVQGGTILTTRELAREVGFGDLPRGVDTAFLAEVRRRGGTVYAADRFNFVSVRRADPGSHTWQITDRQLMARSSQLLFYGVPWAHAEA